MRPLLFAPLLLAASIAQAADSVKIYNWSSYIAPDTLKNFQAASGIVPTYDVFDSNETLDGKLMTGNSGYDVVFPSNHFMARQIQGKALKALEVNDPGNRYGFPYLWGSTGIGYNIDKVKAALGENAPVDSWDLIFKPENISKLKSCGVAILDNGPELLPIALNYLGLPHHSQDPADYEKAKALLMKVRPYISYFHSSKYTGDLANGDICVVVGFSGDVLQARNRAEEARNGVKVGYEIPREGAPMWFDMVAMPADAPDEKAGYAYMNYLLQPEVMADISNHVQYANGNQAADRLVDPALKANSMIYPTDAMLGKLFALQAMPAKIDRLRTRIWTSIKAGN
ncbi:spermidine/putrescine ABC transporter substrate-binding protein [Pseudomonas putida]|nr:spermidine/putrescine ABC transporter substrate-binding protein [Pseudomonas putida]